MNMNYRNLYMPAHFGNSYECMADYEMRDLLSEAKHWGYTAYSDWFDAADLKDPYQNPKDEYLLPQALWDRKMASFRIAQELGLQLELGTTPNHVFANQLRPDILADTRGADNMFGQLVCPSNPEGRRVIIDNFRNLFTDFQKRGIRLQSISGGPYDYGGCNCPACRPWIRTFGELMLDIAQVARETMGEVALRVIGWWWTEEEQRQFKQWADEKAPGRFASFAAHIQYGQTRPANAPIVPEGCELHAFVHIGYADQAQPSDVYGKWGPVCAPRRLEQTVKDLAALGCTGVMAYDEGAFADVNRALLAGLSSGRQNSSRAVLEAYARRCFRARTREKAAAWADWLAAWGAPFENEAAAASEAFARLAGKGTKPWRLRQWDHKRRLFDLNRRILAIDGWPAERVALAGEFLTERDRMYRETWGLGPVRHVLNPRSSPPAWLGSYLERVNLQASAVRVVSEA